MGINESGRQSEQPQEGKRFGAPLSFTTAWRRQPTIQSRQHAMPPENSPRIYIYTNARGNNWNSLHKHTIWRENAISFVCFFFLHATRCLFFPFFLPEL